MSETSTLTGPDTTVDAPACPECIGSGFFGVDDENCRTCPACEGDGYERGDTASLDASCPPESPDPGPDDAALILTALDRLREQEKRQGFAGTANQFQETFHPDLIGMLWAQGA